MSSEVIVVASPIGLGAAAVVAAPVGVAVAVGVVIKSAVDALREEIRRAKEEELRRLAEQQKRFEEAERQRKLDFEGAQRQLSPLQQILVAEDIVRREALLAELGQLENYALVRLGPSERESLVARIRERRAMARSPDAALESVQQGLAWIPTELPGANRSARTPPRRPGFRTSLSCCVKDSSKP